MTVSLIFSGRMEQAPPPELDQFWADLSGAKLYLKWKLDNPGELSRLRAFAAGGTKPSMLTPFGRALVEVVEAQRQLGDTTISIP